MTFNILFTLNNQYAPHVGALIVSILQSQPEDTTINFHLVSGDFSIENQRRIAALKAIRDFNIMYYDANAYGIDWQRFKIRLPHTTIETYYRLFAHEFLKDLDKVLHLDIDVLVFRDLSSFWNTNIAHAFVAGVPCPLVKGEHLIPAGFRLNKDHFMLAGSNLFNLKKMREDNLSDKVFEILEKYQSILRFQDQDIMNLLFKGKGVPIPLKYNAVTSIFEERDPIDALSPDRAEEIEEAISMPVVVHFSRKIKAWHKQSRNPYAKFYWHYLEQTPWKGTVCDKVSFKLAFKMGLRYMRFWVRKNQTFRCLYRMMQPQLDRYMKKIIAKCIKKNQAVGFSGYREGLTFFSHISPSDPLFVYFEDMLKCRFTNDPDQAEAMLLWGTKFFIDRYQVLRKGIRHHLPLILAEDGFLRSINISAQGAPGLSVMLDHAGIHYDADLGCLFDQVLNSDFEINEDQNNQSRQAMAYLRDHHISKYNLVPPKSLNFNVDHQYHSVVLVIDQRKGDQSVSGAKADEHSFSRMLQDAIEENPKSLILIKTHPDALSGGFQGYYSGYQPKVPNVRLLKENLNPISLLKAVDTLYVVSSQMGMEGLICGKIVHCYGAPFYSGWGLTVDRGFVREHKRPRSLEDIFYVSYIKYTHYFSPDTGQPTDIFGLMAYLNKAMQKLNTTQI